MNPILDGAVSTKTPNMRLTSDSRLNQKRTQLGATEERILHAPRDTEVLADSDG